MDRQVCRGFGEMSTIYWGQIITTLMMAIALGMDAFSLGIGIGMQRLSWLQILKISVTVGIFHIFMPLIGMATGHFLSDLIGNVAIWIGGGILVYLGLNMIWGSFKTGEPEAALNQTAGIGLIILAFSVSVDALSVGLSLGLFSAHLSLTVMLFGIVGGIMTALGLAIGSRVGGWLGDYGEAFGGVILLVFGIRFLV